MHLTHAHAYTHTHTHTLPRCGDVHSPQERARLPCNDSRDDKGRRQRKPELKEGPGLLGDSRREEDHQG